MTLKVLHDKRSPTFQDGPIWKILFLMRDDVEFICPVTNLTNPPLMDLQCPWFVPLIEDTDELEGFLYFQGFVILFFK